MIRFAIWAYVSIETQASGDKVALTAPEDCAVRGGGTLDFDLIGTGNRPRRHDNGTGILTCP